MLAGAVGWSRGGTLVAPLLLLVIFSLRSVWPQALGFSARLVCVEMPPVAHPAESRVSWPGGYGPIIPQWQTLGEIVSLGDF